jgi:DnaJ-class molecular chaperone
VLPRRLNFSRAAIQALAQDDGAFRRTLTDEVAIDFPSAQAAIECLRRLVPDTDAPAHLSAEIAIGRAQAAAGALVPLSLELPHTCSSCGGRGEVWGEPCEACVGEGHAVSQLWIEVRVPPGAADGDRVRFAVTPRRGPRTRVDVRLAVT